MHFKMQNINTFVTLINVVPNNTA